MENIEKITTANFTKNLKNPVPVYGDRFNEMVDDVNANFTELADSTVGADPTPVATRTNNPIVATNTVNANIDALDAAIGADPTPVARTQNNPVVVNTPVNQKIDALDAAIGFDAQLSGATKNISNTNTVYQNLDSLDIYKTVRTIRKTIGAPGLASMDYNFASAANQTEQVITLTDIVPAKARILDVMLFTSAVFSNAVSLSTDIGLTSGGAEIAAAADMQAANAINAIAVGASTVALPTAAARSIFVNATPGANWDVVGAAGSMEIFVTIIDLNNVV